MSLTEINNLFKPTEVDSSVSFREIRSFGKSQKFNPFVDELSLNESKGIVETVGKIDLTEKINSAYDSNLDKLLDAYLNGDVKEEVIYLDGSDKVVAEFGYVKSKIDAYQDLAIEAEKLKKVFKLDDSMKFDDVFRAVSDIKSRNDAKIKDYNEKIKKLRSNPVQPKPNDDVEVKDEKKKA